MKNFPLLLLSILVLTLLACGPSEAEIKKAQAEREKIIADSIAQVFEKKAQLEKEAKVVEERLTAEARLREKRAANSPAQLKRSLIQIETENPMRYITSGFKLDFKLLAAKNVIKGKIFNNATLASYKDFNIEVYCYSKTGTLIKTLRKTIYEYIRANSSKAFEYKFKAPSGTKTVDMQVVGAKVS